jgi:predicted Zn finger-like uncharacterized protein
MAIQCPQCASAADLADDDLGRGGRMVRCQQCGTRWFARRFDGDPYERPAPAIRLASASAEIADAVVIEHVGSGLHSLPPPHHREPRPAAKVRIGRETLRKTAIILGALVAIVLVWPPIVSALPVLGGLPSAVDQLEFQRVRSETVELQGNSTLFVEGEVVNRSEGEVALPAIRITLRSPDGDAVHSWLVEPSVAGLAPGDTVGFRSALASPPADATQVTLTLASREGAGSP